MQKIAKFLKDFGYQDKFWTKYVSHGCSNHLNLEMEAECLTKNLSHLNLNISRKKMVETSCKKYILEQGRVIGRVISLR